MFIASFTITGSSPYSQSRFHGTPKLDKELADAYEERTWREKSHYNKEGMVYVPSHSIKKSVESAAQFLQLQIPGKGKSQYRKHFERGIMVDGVGSSIGVHKDQMECTKLMQNADGVSGSGKRVMRIFPIFHTWEARFTFIIMDEIITESVFKEVLKASGTFIGIGRWRPENRGNNGRFTINDFVWEGR